VQPHQISDFLALVGNVSDDIPGALGIGKVTAQKSLKNFTTVESLLKNVGEISTLSMRGSSALIEKLIDYEAQIKLAKILATIVVDIPLIQSVNDLSLQRLDTKKYRIFFGNEFSLPNE
jgi:5'-3' exonuclease